MPKSKVLLVSLSVHVLIACTASPVHKDPAKAARNGLDAFKKAMDAGTADVLGFKDVEEGKASTLGEPIRLYETACKSFLGAKDTAVSVDPRTSAIGERYYYPVLGASGRKVCLIQVSRLTSEDGYGKPGYWSPVQVGTKSLMARLDSAMRRYPNEKASSLFVVQSTALDMAFLGRETPDGIRLSPLLLSASAETCLRSSNDGDDLRAGAVYAALSKCHAKEEDCREYDPGVLKLLEAEASRKR